jgi:hypothetical protein
MIKGKEYLAEIKGTSRHLIVARYRRGIHLIEFPCIF